MFNMENVALKLGNVFSYLSQEFSFAVACAFMDTPIVIDC